MNRLPGLIFSTLLLGGLIGMTASCTQSNAPDAPVANKKPKTLTMHGDERIDEFFWMNERDAPEVLAYLESENEYADQVMKHTERFQKRLVKEMKSRIKPDDQSAPIQVDDFFYYTRYESNKDFPIYCRREGSMESAEEILLDANDLAGKSEYFQIRNFKVSDDHRVAAYAVDTVGRRIHTIYFRDLETGKMLDDRIEGVTLNFTWAADSKTVFYVRQDPETLRWTSVFRHTLGSDDDTLVYFEEDVTYDAAVYRTRSRKYIGIGSYSTLTTEHWLLPADKPTSAPTVFQPRTREHEYHVADGGDRFFIRSNDGAPNFRVFEADPGKTSREHWREIVPHNSDKLLEDIDAFRNYVVLSGKADGLDDIEIIDRTTGSARKLEFDDPAYWALTGDNVDFDSEWLRYYYESLTTPDSVLEFNMRSGERRLLKEQPVLGGFNRDNYTSERTLATAADGTKIPVSLVYRKGMERNGQNPLLQYGYGSYGLSTEPTFNSDRLSLLDRGFIFAIAHIRGGSEMGRQWYEDGKLKKKINTFTDFTAVTEHLIAEKYTSPEHMYATGGSAGGLLMGAVINLRPDLYNGVFTRVPFVDVVTTMLDDTIPLTTSEYDEWGNPNEKEFYDYMLSYSPYDNVEEKAYPNLLVTTGYHDSQVQYWEPAKWVARLRDRKTDNNWLLLKTDMSAGHSGKAGRFERLNKIALDYAFILDLEGIKD